jgi:hypothetical protein
VRGFFNKIPESLKMALWKGLAIPYNLIEREHADAWLTVGAASHFYQKTIEFNAELKILLGKIDTAVYIETVAQAADDKTTKAQDKIFRFLANNMELFNFFAKQLSKKDTFLYKFLNEYIQFRKGYRNVSTLRSEYDKHHIAKNKRQKLDPYALPPKSTASVSTTSQSTTALVTSGLQKTVSDKDEKIISIDMKAIHGDSKPRNTESEIINVRSVDFDKSLYNSAYYSSYSRNKPNIFLECNKIFIDSVLKDIAEMNYEEVIFMNGSQRQSYPSDEFCCMMKVDAGSDSFVISESCFVSLPKLVNHIGRRSGKDQLCRLDGYMLVDTFAQLKKGSVFSEAMLQDEFHILRSKLMELICVDDKSRLLILYAQMNKMASEHVGKQIYFDFYSADRGQLQVLYEIFMKHVSLKPKNVLLRLLTYDGSSLECSFQVENYFQGLIDHQYDKNVKIILDSSQEKPVPIDPEAKMEIKPGLGSFNTVMPATLTLNAAHTFSMEKFEKKRIFSVTLPVPVMKTIANRSMEITSFGDVSSPTNSPKNSLR